MNILGDTTITGLHHFSVEIYENVPLNKSGIVDVKDGMIHFKSFPSGCVVAFKYGFDSGVLIQRIHLIDLGFRRKQAPLKVVSKSSKWSLTLILKTVR